MTLRIYRKTFRRFTDPTLSLRRCFLSMKKDDMQMMHTWIAAVRHLAHELTEAGTLVTDDDAIIVLTLGLPPTYENFVITLDVTPDEQLTLDLIITHLLNEESRQLMANGAESHHDCK
jgi:gag-polypeptide of LTR copia-type